MGQIRKNQLRMGVHRSIMPHVVSFHIASRNSIIPPAAINQIAKIFFVTKGYGGDVCSCNACVRCTYDGRILLQVFQRQKPLMQNI